MAARSQHEFSANYRRFTPEATVLLMRLSETLGVIRGARVLPAVADQLRASARVGTVHYSNLIEGNELPAIEAERATRGELTPDTRAKVELINYVAALDLLDERLDSGRLALKPELLLDLHRVTTRDLGRRGDPHFRPQHEGAWRDGIALVVDRLTGRVMHEGPPPEEVPGRVESMFEWAVRMLGRGEPPHVVAGVVHYGITDIHPFADGNGRVARLFQSAILMHAGVLPGRMFSFERYYADDRQAYYAALRSVRARTLNMESWLEYFLRGLVEEYERIARTVEDLGAFGPAGGVPPLQLSPSQQAALTALRISGPGEFTRVQYERAAGVARSAAGADLAALSRHGVLHVRGAGPATRYSFAAQPGSDTSAAPGRPVGWTDARIERELRTFLSGWERWPTRGEFEAAGRRDLHAAASRNGGIGRWRALLGPWPPSTTAG
ncbi:Fic family protein [Conexibacter stalactiti]|uniref:Fic family protein n=1 Tax=Conexibacter stalactiti TaxID=1940611 RepID=A0ABU4HS78_9ACTN|nr:Fic family protein [Conexibacter stalactiti]MDW5596177.1 Fic family protein [Conexibacter stalactiti]MEC5036819.1 Fic family protein [Conexibacter stalactiti]